MSSAGVGPWRSGAQSPLRPGCGRPAGAAGRCRRMPDSLWKTYRGRLRKLIFANLPLLLLIIGCLPLFLVLVPTASSLSSHSAQLTPLGGAEEFDKPASSEAANAASRKTRASPATAAAEAEVQHAPQLPERRRPLVTNRKSARRTDVVTHHVKRHHTTRRRHRTTQDDQEEMEKEMLTTTPKRRRENSSTAGEKLLKPESELRIKQVTYRTQGPPQELTGPKGRRLVRRVVRKRRKTTPLAGNASSAVSASPMGLGTTVNADDGLEGRKLDEAQELAERLWGIIAETATSPSSRIGMTSGPSATSIFPRRSSFVYSQATEAVSDEKSRRRSDILAPNFGANSAATYGLPTNDTCVSSSQCRTLSYDDGSGSRRMPQDGVAPEEPTAFQHSAELPRDSTPPSGMQGKAPSANGPMETTVMSSGGLDLLDWLFAHEVNNGLSKTEPAGKKELKTESSLNLAAKTSDNWSDRFPRISAAGAGSSPTAKNHELTSKRFKNQSTKSSDHIIGVETAATSSSYRIATNSELEAETFRRLLHRSNVSSLSSTSSPSQTPLEAFSDMSKGLGTGKVSEGTVSQSYLPPNESLATASRGIQLNGNRISGPVGKPFPFTTESDAGGENADSSLKGSVEADEGSSEEDYDDDYEEDDDDDAEEDNFIKKGLLPTFGRRQGLLSGPERRKYSDNQTRTPFSAGDKNLGSRSSSASASGGENKEPPRNFGGATQKHGVNVSSEDGGLRHGAVGGAAGGTRNLRLDPPAPSDVSGRSGAPKQATIENLADGSTPVASSSSESDELTTTSLAEERIDSPTKQSGIGDAEARAGGNSVQTAVTEGYTPSHEHPEEVPRLVYNAESHNLSELTKAVAPTKASGNMTSVNATTSSEQRSTASGGAVSRNHTGLTVHPPSIPPLPHLGEIPNASIVPEAPKTELSKEITTGASTRRRLRLETTQHNTAPDVLELTSPTGTVSSKAQGHSLPEKLHIMCSIGATYPGPYPVELCDKIMIKDAVSFDQVRIKFTVRSYDAFLALKAQQIKRPSFKIVGLMTWRNIEQFRLLNPSSDAFVEKVDRLLLRINLDGLCMDLAGVTRGNIMAYRHILRDMRVRLMDTKFLCSLFDYNVLYKASFQDLLSLLRVFNTTVIYQSVQSISNMETSVPNALRHLTKRKYSLTAALELAMEIRGTSRHRGVCWTLTPWGMEYRLLIPNEATGVGVLARFVRSAVSGSDLCTTYRKLPRTYDNMTASWYFVNDTKWVAYDDRNSLEQKIPQLLAAYAPDCVYVEDVQRDDARGVCDRPFPLVSSLQGMLAEAHKYTTHLAGSSTTTASLALVSDRQGEVV